MEGWQEVDAYFILYAGTAGMLLLCGGMLLFFRAYTKRLLIAQQEKSDMELQYKDELLYANVAATEEERARIARDLHDEVGASLSLLRMQMHNMYIDESAASKTVIDNTIDTVRRISHDLQPPSLATFGLVTALQQHCDQVVMNTVIDIHLDVFDEHTRFSALVELSVYRIVQELVHNTIKHSGASAINIGLQQQENELMLSYQDNGKGYDHTTLQKEHGLGLKNIELRIKQCNGKLTYTTTNEGQVNVTINIPITV